MNDKRPSVACGNLLARARMTLDYIAAGKWGATEAEAMANDIADAIGHRVTDQEPTVTLTHPAQAQVDADRAYRMGYLAGRDGDATTERLYRQVNAEQERQAADRMALGKGSYLVDGEQS